MFYPVCGTCGQACGVVEDKTVFPVAYSSMCCDEAIENPETIQDCLESQFVDANEWRVSELNA